MKKTEIIGSVGVIGTGAAGGLSGQAAAIGITTTFGTASTGTAISRLRGVASTNAATAWLGGGALAAGDGGMAAGSAVCASIPIASAVIAMGGIGYRCYTYFKKNKH